MAGAVDGDHVWKRLCGHWCWSRNSDGEDDGEQEESVIRLVIFSLLGVAEMSAMTSGVECTSP